MEPSLYCVEPVEREEYEDLRKTHMTAQQVASLAKEDIMQRRRAMNVAG